MTIYNKLKLEFISSHQNHSNVLVHLFTTFGFYISMISLMNTGISAAVQQNIFKAILKSLLQGLQAALDIFIVICESVIKERLPLCNCFLSKVEPFNENHVSFYINAFLWIIYSLSIISLVSFRISVISTCLIVIAFCISNMSNLSLVSSSLLFVASYVLQDFAHFMVSESTYQSRYTPGTPGSPITSWIAFYKQLFMHSYFMLPLVIESAFHVSLFEAILSWFLVVDRLIKLKLDSKEAEHHLGIVRKWLDDQNLARNVTTHYWFADLPPHVKNSFAAIANEPVIFKRFNSYFSNPEYTTVSWESMNEVYVAATDTTEETSDNVFYSNHVDGPFMCYPFTSVYRAIVAVNSNDYIKTVFPAHPCEKTLTDGEMWAFDFNREVHRIEQVKQPSELRYTLKLHYLVYLSNLPYYGYLLGTLTSWYDTIARLVFLKTLVPKTLIERSLWNVVMLTTRVFYESIRAAGNSGAISFLALSGIIMYFTQTELPLFLICSSFVHYFIYISTYYHYETHRNQIAFEGFKRTVMFYKAVAFYHLIVNYVAHMESPPDMISLLMIAIGFSISGMAAKAIGIDQTYFGVELGRCKPAPRVTLFPYNLTAHPMIIGNIIGLLGFMKLDGFRHAFPWLVPAHIIFYTIHMIQEHFDIKKIPVTANELKEE